MDFEIKNSYQTEEDESPEIIEEIKTLDEKAREVALELEDADIENMESVKRDTIKEKLLLLAGAFMVIGGAGKAVYDLQSLSTADFHSVEDGVKAVFNSKMGFNVSSTLVGLVAFLANYWKLGDAFKKEEGRNSKAARASAK